MKKEQRLHPNCSEWDERVGSRYRPELTPVLQKRDLEVELVFSEQEKRDNGFAEVVRYFNILEAGGGFTTVIPREPGTIDPSYGFEAKDVQFCMTDRNLTNPAVEAAHSIHIRIHCFGVRIVDSKSVFRGELEESLGDIDGCDELIVSDDKCFVSFDDAMNMVYG